MRAANWMPSYCHWNVRKWAQHSLTGWEMRWRERSSCRFWKVCSHHWMNQISDWKSSLDIAACDGCGCDCDCGGEFQLPDPDELSDLEKKKMLIIARLVKNSFKYLQAVSWHLFNLCQRLITCVVCCRKLNILSCWPVYFIYKLTLSCYLQVMIL